MSTLAMDAAFHTKGLKLRFALAIFVGSFLLFLVQPMIARMALPRLGGAPAVWNSAMLVYQALLLGGYSYAHAVSRFPIRNQVVVHFLLLALAALALPIGLIPSTPGPRANPFLWVPWLLLVSIGPLFFVISAQAPMLQRWFAQKGGGDPYPLYAASNFGSFAGLLSYPLLLEPNTRVPEQSWLWTSGYVLMALLVAWCGLSPSVRGTQAEEPAFEEGPKPNKRTVLGWILFASIPSGLILSTTLHLTTDIAAMPLLWVLPLGAYLLSFTVAFGSKRWLARMITNIAPIILLLAICGPLLKASTNLIFLVFLAILNLFVVSVALHSRLFTMRPAARYLTLFYLAMSVGGVVGGIFCALIAPMIFDWTYEHLILIAAAAFLLDSKSPFDRYVSLWNDDSTARRMTTGGALASVLLAVGCAFTPSQSSIIFIEMALLTIGIFAIGNRVLFGTVVASLLLCGGGWASLSMSMTPGRLTRSFFGVYTVSAMEGARILTHGTTVHGVQNRGSTEREKMPTMYYAPLSGVGLALRSTPTLFGPSARIDVVGLGAGTLACYARPGQRWAFYEIDPAVQRIAENSAQFTFLSRCLPGVPVILGDARLTLSQSPPASADVLVIDAFSSDSIPMHLLTAEALQTFRKHLTNDGLLLVHITNRYLNLEPVLAGAAKSAGWHAVIRQYEPDTQRNRTEVRSIWVALSPNRKTLQRLVKLSGEDWRRLGSESTLWTDDYASLLPIIRRRAWGGK